MPAKSQQEQDESIRDILQQKERIRSIITPGNDAEKAKNKALDPGAESKVIQDKDGRSPYDGAQLKVVSIKRGAKKQIDSIPADDQGNKDKEAAAEGKEKKGDDGEK